MDVTLIIFILSLVIYLPLAGILLYVWWKHGAHERAVNFARLIFLLGSFGLFFYMTTL